MNKFLVLIVMVLFPLCLFAQQTDYNRKGDEAMKRQDFRDARMWYEEGIPFCDSYSIEKLTRIWLDSDSRRSSMYSTMVRCLSCLNEKVMQNDTTAMSLLVTYYKEGIGTTKSPELESYWSKQLEQLRHPMPPVTTQTEEKEIRIPATTPLRFFVGYAFSTEMPYGITFGMMGKRVGAYLRLKTNFSFDNSLYDCTDESIIKHDFEESSYQLDTNKKLKANGFTASAGVMVQTTSWLYASVGLGYGNRTLLCPFLVTDYKTGAVENIWCKNIDSSMKGVVAEIDLTVKVGAFYVSGGCNTINFNYVDLNAGVGMFF